MNRKIKSMLAVLALCGIMGMGINAPQMVKSSEIWGGIACLASSRAGASPGEAFMIGAIGAMDSAVWGFAVGAAAGAGVGALVGFGVGL